MLLKSAPKMNDFYLRIFDVVKLIPEGRVTSYGHIAKALGSGGSSRVVGYAMNKSHVHDPNIPAHRVVNRNGLLTGRAHFNPPELMQELLEKEGIAVKDNRVVDFEKLFWDPMELGDI